MSNILIFYFFPKNMGKNINIIKNLKTKNSFRFIEGSNVNQVAATT